ncbi:MAG: type II toxin-antitoxin system PemK/MazF family toxin [Lentisphaeria bacterium]|nr:type II toxin-antitoxin system PemK/MazF family toxin [Lentisphaeria bacterium]
MRRGELYRVKHPSSRDPRKFRVFLVVSRQILIESRFSTVICAPVYTAYEGLTTQVPIGIDEGMKHDCSVHCDELVSIPKSMLTDFVGMLRPEEMIMLDDALKAALQLHDDYR